LVRHWEFMQPRRTIGRLTASSDPEAATWILSGLRAFNHTIGAIVPPVFQAYARVFHPASRHRDGDVAVRWAEVAKDNGREMHPAAEWSSITGSWEFQRHSTQPGIWDTPPSTGRLPRSLAQRLSATLSEHTGNQDHCFFGVWDGWGTGTGMFFFADSATEDVKRRTRDAYDAEVAAWHGLLDGTAAVQIPQRRMHLLDGPLTAIDDFYEPHTGRSGLCLRDPPSLWWPADQRWCVGTDIDLMTTYVGASRTAIDALLADDRLEVLPVSDSQSVTWEADTINPLPAPP
jgi:hypothetical protein